MSTTESQPKKDCNWCKIPDYFSFATQLGMTATLKETKYISNIDYFVKDYVHPGEIIRDGDLGDSTKDMRLPVNISNLTGGRFTMPPWENSRFLERIDLDVLMRSQEVLRGHPAEDQRSNPVCILNIQLESQTTKS